MLIYIVFYGRDQSIFSKKSLHFHNDYTTKPDIDGTPRRVAADDESARRFRVDSFSFVKRLSSKMGEK